MNRLDPNDLAQLQSLDLSRTQVTDLAPLQGLTQLQSLDLSRTQVTDLAPLQGLTQLRELDLLATEVTDLAPLRLVQLQSLDLHVAAQVVDLAGAHAGDPAARGIYQQFHVVHPLGIGYRDHAMRHAAQVLLGELGRERSVTILAKGQLPPGGRGRHEGGQAGEEPVRRHVGLGDNPRCCALSVE